MLAPYMLSSCVCLSVRPSHVGIIPRRLNLGSRKQREEMRSPSRTLWSLNKVRWQPFELFVAPFFTPTGFVAYWVEPHNSNRIRCEACELHTRVCGKAGAAPGCADYPAAGNSPRQHRHRLTYVLLHCRQTWTGHCAIAPWHRRPSFDEHRRPLRI